MVSITCRTEYLTGRHHNSAAAAGLLTVTALVALVGLRVAGVGGMTTAAVVAGLLGSRWRSPPTVGSAGAARCC